MAQESQASTLGDQADPSKSKVSDIADNTNDVGYLDRLKAHALDNL